MVDYEVIVVGAGVEGSATAYHLAKQGTKTLLLEQFPLPHTRGSSHGQSRIIRKAYVEAYYTEMMLEAYPMWRQLEKESNSTLYKNTGMIVIAKKGSDCVSKTTAALAGANCKHKKVSSQELSDNYSMLKFDDSYEGVLDLEAGILHADKCLAKLQEMFIRFGGTLLDREKVTEIHPGKRVFINTSSGKQFRANSLVITAGPWASQLIKPLGIDIPLQPVRVTVCYWKHRSNPAAYRVGSQPIFICNSTDNKGNQVDIYGLPANEYPDHAKPRGILVCYWRVKAACSDTHTFESGLPTFSYHQRTLRCHAYGLPSYEYPGLLKICFHGGPPIDPDARDVHPDMAWDIDAMKNFVRNHLPGVEDVPSITERCIYTMTPDEDFVLDTHPAWKNIVIGAGFSGHGFKLAPVVGKILGSLATSQKLSYDMSPFRIDRFNMKANL